MIQQSHGQHLIDISRIRRHQMRRAGLHHVPQCQGEQCVQHCDDNQNGGVARQQRCPPASTPQGLGRSVVEYCEAARPALLPLIGVLLGTFDDTASFKPTTHTKPCLSSAWTMADAGRQVLSFRVPLSGCVPCAAHRSGWGEGWRSSLRKWCGASWADVSRRTSIPAHVLLDSAAGLSVRPQASLRCVARTTRSTVGCTAPTPPGRWRARHATSSESAIRGI